VPASFFWWKSRHSKSTLLFDKGQRMSNFNVDVLRACINEIAGVLGNDEAIVGIRQGALIPSHNAQIPFLIDVAKVDNTGQLAGSRRGIVALVTSNSPHQVQLTGNSLLPAIPWTPL
jgi:hypothetical protein